MDYASAIYVLNENNAWYEPKEIIIEYSETINLNRIRDFKKVESITLSEGWEVLPQDSFAYLENLKTVYLPSTIKTIDYNAFYECSNLEKVYYYGSMAQWCSISFVTEYSNPVYYADAFYMMDANNKFTAVQTLNINESVQTINSFAFAGFDFIKMVYISKSLLEIKDYAFYRIESFENIYYYGDFNSLIKVTFGDNNANPFLMAKNIYMIDENNNWIIPTKAVITEDVDAIQRELFKVFTNLEIIDIRSNVNVIDYRAFYNLKNLYELYLPASLQYIGSYAFSQCNNLESVYYYGTIEDWMNIQFDGWSSNPMYYAESIYMLNENNKWSEIEEIRISEGITSISYNQFRSFKDLETVYIPASIKYIGSEAFYECSNLENVYYYGTIEDWMNIQFEGSSSNPMNYARNFYLLNENGEWYQINEVAISEGETEIKAYQFRYFRTLNSIYIPASIKYIGSEAFYECNNLTNVYYYGTLEDWMNIEFADTWSSNPMSYARNFYMLNDKGAWYQIKDIVIKEGTTEILEYQYRNFNSVQSIYLPSTIQTINYGAFEGCYNLENVYYDGTIEQWMNITFINSWSSNPMYYAKNFYMLNEDGQWYKPTQIVIPDNVTSIKDYQFRNFTSLTTIYLPKTIETVGSEAFYECYNLTNVYYYGTIEDWMNIDFINWSSNPTYYAKNFYIFNENNEWNKVLEIIVPDGTTTIEDNKYNGLRSVKSVYIPASVTTIGYEAFSNCEGLQSVYYGGTIEQWMNIKFESWSSNPMQYAHQFYMLNENNEWYQISELVIPEGVTEIKSYQFKNFTSVRRITLPSTLETIGSEAFYNLEGLLEITNNSKFNLIPGNWDWEQGYVSAYALMVNNRGKVSYRYNDTGIFEYIETEDGFVFLHFGYEYYLISYKGDQEVPVLPYRINGNTYYCRYMDSSITHVELSRDFLDIPSSMFDGCRSLESVIVPDTIDYIWYNAFSNCTNLKEINIPNSVWEIGSYAFSNCISLESIEIPSSVYYIGGGAFYNCTGLTSITIPEAVEGIEGYTFYGCTNLTEFNLPTNIYYVGENAFYNTAYYNNEENWNNGFLYLDNILLKANSYITEYYLPEGITCIASRAFEHCYSLKIVEVTGNSGNIFYYCSNIELLIINDMLNGSIGSYFYPYPSITLSKVIVKNDVIVNNNYQFDGINNVKIFVDEYELNVQWDHDYPNWSNNNEVFYKGEWVNVKFYDYDNTLLMEDYLSVFEMIRQPILRGYVEEGVKYNFVGWDIDGDNIVDDYPAMSNIDLTAKAIYSNEPYTYTVTYYDIDEFTVLYQEEYKYGDILELKVAPNKKGYTFDTWTNYPEDLVVTKDLSIYSRWTHIDGGHQYSQTVVEPTCHEEGYSIFRCTLCDHEYKDMIIAPIGHDYGEWIIDIVPTCLTEGTKHHICSICGHREDDIAYKAEHDYNVEVISESTCEQNGEIKYTCKVCDDTFSEYVAIANHNYKKKVVHSSIIQLLLRYIMNLFYGVEGKDNYYYECKNCGHILLNNEVNQLMSVQGVCSHSNVDWVIVKEAGCIEDGYTAYTCKGCNKVFEAKYISSKGGHSYTTSFKWKGSSPEFNVICANDSGHNQIFIPDVLVTIIKEATETEAGIKEYTASITYDGVLYTEKMQKHYNLVTKGDFDGNDQINTDDVVYLLMSSYFPEEYPVEQECDYNEDKVVNTDDVVYLLMHIYFPEEYPVEKAVTLSSSNEYDDAENLILNVYDIETNNDINIEIGNYSEYNSICYITIEPTIDKKQILLKQIIKKQREIEQYI